MSKPRLLVVIGILLLSLILRLHNYAIYPQRGATSDEYSYSFLGVSLYTKHIPISWSPFDVYTHQSKLTIQNLFFPIVYPYFDHPPLNGLVVGAWALLNGEDTFEKIQLSTIRLMPIAFSMLSSLLVFSIGYKLFDYKTGVWALLIYTTTVIFVIQSRVVLAENLLTTFFLAALYLFLEFKKSLTIGKTIILGILCGLSFWTKELGITVFFSLLYLFLIGKIKLKFVVILSAVSLFFVLLYFLYGWYYDWGVFLKVIARQSARNIGSETLLYITSTPIIVNKIYNDGWYFLGYVSLFLALLEYDKVKMILAPAMIYFLLLIFSLEQKGEMGWYIIPLFPFMALFTAYFWIHHMKKHSWFIFLALLFIGLYEIEYIYKVNFGLTAMQFRIMMCILFIPFLYATIFKKDYLFRLLAHVWFYLFILGNIFLTYNYIHPA